MSLFYHYQCVLLCDSAKYHTAALNRGTIFQALSGGSVRETNFLYINKHNDLQGSFKILSNQIRPTNVLTMNK